MSKKKREVCKKCGSTALEKKGKNKDGSQRFGNVCKPCAAGEERKRYAKKVKCIKRRTYMQTYDVLKCKTSEEIQPSSTPDGLVSALQDFAFSTFLANEEYSDETIAS